MCVSGLCVCVDGAGWAVGEQGDSGAQGAGSAAAAAASAGLTQHNSDISPGKDRCSGCQQHFAKAWEPPQGRDKLV